MWFFWSSSTKESEETRRLQEDIVNVEAGLDSLLAECLEFQGLHQRPPRFLLIGKQHHGKSSFLNTCQYVMGRQWGQPLVAAAATGGNSETCTKHPKKHYLLMKPVASSLSNAFQMKSGHPDWGVATCIEVVDVPGFKQNAEYIEEIRRDVFRYLLYFAPDCVLLTMSLQDVDPVILRMALAVRNIPGKEGLELLIVGTKADRMEGVRRNGKMPVAFAVDELKSIANDSVIPISNYLGIGNQKRNLDTDKHTLLVLRQAIAFAKDYASAKENPKSETCNFNPFDKDDM